jgi:hypothetical protein
VEHIYRYVNEILNVSKLHHTKTAVVDFCDESIERHSHLITSIGMDENLRLSQRIEVTPKILVNGTMWFKTLCQEMDIDVEYLTILQNQIWVTQGKKAMPLTKQLAKSKYNLLSNRFKWHMYIEPKINDVGIVIARRQEGFLAELGEITRMNKVAVISCNPGDYLRNALYPEYATFTTCHNLRNGQYSYGVLNYALDKNHLVNYLHNEGDERMTSRTMMYISEDMKVVAQRRFYPTPEIFGAYRAEMMRAMVHKALNFGSAELKTNVFASRKTALGYIDPIKTWTFSGDDVDINNYEDTMQDDLYCFTCNKLHSNKSKYCIQCHPKYENLKFNLLDWDNEIALKTKFVSEMSGETSDHMEELVL